MLRTFGACGGLWFDPLRICKNRKNSLSEFYHLGEAVFSSHILKGTGEHDPKLMTLTLPCIPMRHTKFQGNLSKYVDFKALSVDL